MLCAAGRGCKSLAVILEIVVSVEREMPLVLECVHECVYRVSLCNIFSIRHSQGADHHRA